MTDKRAFLNEVYGVKTVDDTRRLYDDWAQSYDAEITENGYATPARIAQALATRLDPGAPILDFGCGTGISGAAMSREGFTTIDGCDLSAGMLAKARATGIYRRLWQANGPLRVEPGAYGAIAAVGVVSVGAAPPETMDSLIEALAPGGLFAFSFNDHTFEDPRFQAKVNAHLTSGTCRQLLRETGPHLPGINLNSTIFILEKT